MPATRHFGANASHYFAHLRSLITRKKRSASEQTVSKKHLDIKSNDSKQTKNNQTIKQTNKKQTKNNQQSINNQNITIKTCPFYTRNMSTKRTKRRPKECPLPPSLDTIF